MTQDEIIELAKEAYLVEKITTFEELMQDEPEYVAELNKFAEFILASQAQPTPSQSEPVWVLQRDSKNIISGTSTSVDISKFPDGTKLYTKPQPKSQDVLDAERYRWLKPNYAMANFDIYDAEKGESKQSGIIFEMPDGLSYGADLDDLIDAAMKESK